MGAMEQTLHPHTQAASLAACILSVVMTTPQVPRLMLESPTPYKGGVTREVALAQYNKLCVEEINMGARRLQLLDLTFILLREELIILLDHLDESLADNRRALNSLRRDWGFA